MRKSGKMDNSYKLLQGLLEEDLKVSFGFEKTCIYKENAEFRTRVEACFSAFDSAGNKFEDHVFNPLKDLPEDLTLKRMSEYSSSEGLTLKLELVA